MGLERIGTKKRRGKMLRKWAYYALINLEEILHMALLFRWCLNALALMLVAYLYSGVQVTSIWAALLAALVLGLVNALIRPVLVILTLPVTLLTLGLFIFVINALLFWLVATMVDGFAVRGFVAALIGSLMFSVITMITSWLITGTKKSVAKS
jgi:putative membrane protein